MSWRLYRTKINFAISGSPFPLFPKQTVTSLQPQSTIDEYATSAAAGRERTLYKLAQTHVVPPLWQTKVQDKCRAQDAQIPNPDDRRVIVLVREITEPIATPEEGLTHTWQSLTMVVSKKLTFVSKGKEEH
jgi:hypothetical protein